MTRISSDKLGLDGIYINKNAANGIYGLPDKRQDFRGSNL